MAKPTPLQEQLLKAGLVKKSKVAQAAREQLKARHGKGPAEPSDVHAPSDISNALAQTNPSWPPATPRGNR